jgi:hypothetical protein
MKEENGGERGAHCWAAYGGVISNPFKPCVFGPWRGQASPLHFQKESTGFDIISLNVNPLKSGKNPENMVSFS